MSPRCAPRWPAVRAALRRASRAGCAVRSDPGFPWVGLRFAAGSTAAEPPGDEHQRGEADGGPYDGWHAGPGGRGAVRRRGGGRGGLGGGGGGLGWGVGGGGGGGVRGGRGAAGVRRAGGGAAFRCQSV